MSAVAQVTVLAPGLLGGSVARAVREIDMAERVVVWARRPEVRYKLSDQTWCDIVADTAEEAVAEASIVVVSTPVDKVLPLLRQLAPALPPDVLVMDVGSVKGEIARHGEAALGGRGHFVGAHPMAGSEKTGWEFSTPTLFVKRTCFITRVDDSNLSALERAMWFWNALGAEVVTVTPDEHDEIVAHISHLPQVIASALCAFLAGKNPAWRNYAGGGLRDTTRIASSDPRLWRTILEQNRDEVLAALREFGDELHEFQAALANRNYAEVVARMERGKEYRDRFRPQP